MASKKTSKKNKRSGFTAAFIVLSFIVILILFFVKKDTIITNLQETRFFDRVFGTTPAFVEKHEPSEKKSKQAQEEATGTLKIQTEKKQNKDSEKNKKGDNAQTNVVSQQEKVEKIEKPEPKEIEKPNVSATTSKVESETKKTSEKPASNTNVATENNSTATTSVKSEIKYTELSLCFVEIDSDGGVVRKMIKRTIPKNDSPLTTALKLLMQGPDNSMATEKNCRTLIPEGTKLLSAKVQDGVAILDFSENFEFNEYGVEGYNGQLMQIVYTATNFSTVKSVQFLIEGEKKEYLGSEGQWIGSPLSRNNF
ncbi:MAG: GerMN domain-containing protein [Treponema sp.]|nr:GerMN domain-containing protein [Treponema sp.]